MKQLIKIKLREYLIESQNNTSTVFYHGTGEKQKVIEALKNNTFNFHKSAGVETGIWLSRKESLAIEYAKIANGNDKGVIEVILEREPKLKTYKNPSEMYDDEIKYDYFLNKSMLMYIEDMLKQGYDGIQSNDGTFMIFKEKVNIIKVL